MLGAGGHQYAGRCVCRTALAGQAGAAYCQAAKLGSKAAGGTAQGGCAAAGRPACAAAHRGLPHELEPPTYRYPPRWCTACCQPGSRERSTQRCRSAAHRTGRCPSAGAPSPRPPAWRCRPAHKQHHGQGRGRSMRQAAGRGGLPGTVCLMCRQTTPTAAAMQCPHTHTLRLNPHPPR